MPDATDLGHYGQIVHTVLLIEAYLRTTGTSSLEFRVDRSSLEPGKTPESSVAEGRTVLGVIFFVRSTKDREDCGRRLLGPL